MKKFVEFIDHKKRLVTIALISSVLLSIYGITQISFNTDFSMFSSNDSIYEERLIQLDESFGSLDQLSILIETETFDTTVQEDLYDIERAFEQLNGLDQIQGVAPETILLNGTPTPYLDISTTMLDSYYSRFAEFSPMTILDGTYYFNYTLFINDSFSKSELTEIEDILSQYSYDTYISGDEYSQAKITDYIVSILLMLPPLAMITIFLVFAFQMRNIKATIFSVLPAAIGSLWTLGIVGLLGSEVSILTAVVPIFIIVIGSADGLHFISHYQDLREEGLSIKEALTKDLEIVGVPMIITTLTSMVGFLSLLTINTDSIVDLAIFSALGIFLAGVATWIVLTFILLKGVHVAQKSRTKKSIPVSHGLQKLWGLPSMIIVTTIVIVSLLFIGSINNEFDMLMVYKDSTEVRVSADKIMEVNGGSIPLYVTMELDDSPITMNSKTTVDNVVADLSNRDDVTKVISPYRMFDILYSIQTAGEISNDMVLNNLYNTISNDDSNIVHSLINTDEDVVRILVFPMDMTNQTLLDLEQYVEEQDNMTITGTQYLLMDLNTSIGSMQLTSILVALAVVLILMLVSLRNVKIAVLSVLPIVVTIIALYGFLGITQIPLNITTVMIFSITIGVGIDYAVHYSSVYQYYRKQDISKEESVQKSFQSSSRPIIANALGISLGLSIMMLSPLTIHFNVSVLMWVSMIVSVLVTLTLLPTMFKGRD
jgi:predicted RND superfamily exporter protein